MDNSAPQKTSAYNVPKMLSEGATKYLDKGEWIIFIEQLPVGFAEYNLTTDKMRMIGCTAEERELIASYLS